jgi:hypothetical protein
MRQNVAGKLQIRKSLQKLSKPSLRKDAENDAHIRHCFHLSVRFQDRLGDGPSALDNSLLPHMDCSSVLPVLGRQEVAFSEKSKGFAG